MMDEIPEVIKQLPELLTCSDLICPVNNGQTKLHLALRLNYLTMNTLSSCTHHNKINCLIK